ncbi:TetR family transcriptional regulator [Herbaspirillum sp. RTI4]|uniref:TetR family transcriptional regulator n=1 Tax=Herbaspirillum sp. RTI4 TaxID=3048640 RepID=UPI002AB5CFAD|nr:TetR family transcriptional regulator [Herbaspirillum sp. RTI4]MDY7577637.1 TetR family transcriptional regulator [Herbaspirillum sp. RTI4]MEA9982197.1 TetR family transcriptional regulator [Herbaspirillum sp. RTI4]
MSRSTKEEAQETRNRILDAAEDVFNARGVSHTSLAHVATEAKVTRGAIYWHFKNKGDLFDAMCERVRLPMEAIVHGAAERSAIDPLGQLLAGVVWVMKDVVHNPRTRKVVDIIFNKCEIPDAQDPILVRQRECFLDGMGKFTQILRNAITKGQLSEQVDVRRGAIFLHATLSGMLQDWLFAPDSFDLAEDAEAVLSACLHALRDAPSLRIAPAAPV